MPPATYVDVAIPTLVGSPTTLSVLTPTTVKPGDCLLFFVAGPAAFVDDTHLGEGWEILARADAVSGRFTLLRRIVSDDEPASHSFVTSSIGEVGGFLVAYRGLDIGAAAVAWAGVDNTASIAFTCPSLSTAHYSDVCMFVAVAYNAVAFTFDPSANGRVLLQNTVTPWPVFTFAMEDLLPESVGVVASRTLVPSAPSDGQAATFILSAKAAPLAQTILPDVKGGLGFTTIGV